MHEQNKTTIFEPMNPIKLLWYKLTCSKEEYENLLKQDERVRYALQYLRENMFFVNIEHTTYDEDKSEYGIILEHHRCNVYPLYKKGYTQWEVMCIARKLYNPYVDIDANTRNLNVCKFVRFAEYETEYTYLDYDKSKEKMRYSVYEDKIRVFNDITPISLLPFKI